MAARIRKGDRVVVLAGKDKGRTGEVIRVIPDEERAVVRGGDARQEREVVRLERDLGAGEVSQLVEGARLSDAPGADARHPIAQHLHLREDVA